MKNQSIPSIPLGDIRGAFRTLSIIDVLRDLAPFAQFKNREKHSWRSVTFSKACNFTKSKTPPWVFSTFFKMYKWYQITQRITLLECF